MTIDVIRSPVRGMMVVQSNLYEDRCQLKGILKISVESFLLYEIVPEKNVT